MYVICEYIAIAFLSAFPGKGKKKSKRPPAVKVFLILLYFTYIVVLHILTANKLHLVPLASMASLLVTWTEILC